MDIPAQTVVSGPKPVLYLDVDGVPISYHLGFWTEEWRGRNWPGAPAPGVREFLIWATRHFEVRWLTAWACSGVMRPKQIERLAEVLHIELAILQEIRNGCAWRTEKWEGIQWTEHLNGRPFAWLDDEDCGYTDYVAQMGFPGSFYPCDTSAEPEALLRVKQALNVRFGLPL